MASSMSPVSEFATAVIEATPSQSGSQNGRHGYTQDTGLEGDHAGLNYAIFPVESDTLIEPFKETTGSELCRSRPMQSSSVPRSATMTISPHDHKISKAVDVVVMTWQPDQNTTQLARALGAMLFEPSPGHRSLPAPIRYVLQTAQTAIRIFRVRPHVVIYQDPPFITGALLIALRVFFRFRIWANTHSGSFNDPRWTRFATVTEAVFRRCDGMIIHTEFMLNWARKFDVPIVVLRYPGFALATKITDAKEADHILVPLSYSFDEPLNELLDAARQTPELPLIFTGDAPRWMIDAAPPNCNFVGWLSRPHYEDLLVTARGVVSLTNVEHTAQMAAFEAVELSLIHI